MVEAGAFLNPMAAMRVESLSQRRGYGRDLLVLKVVLALGESRERP